MCDFLSAEDDLLQETDHQVAPATSIHQEDEQLLCDLAASSLRRLQSQLEASVVGERMDRFLFAGRP